MGLKKSTLIFYYHRLNCYSFNALAGALDADSSLSDTAINLATNTDDVKTIAFAALHRHERVIVALSVMTCQLAAMQRLVRQLRSDGGTQITILAGGPHVTACPEDVLEAGADAAFRGEAELSFPNLLRSIAQGHGFDSVQSSPHQVDLDLFASMSSKRGMFGPIEITRGCAFSCSYCQTSHIFGTKLRHRGVDSIVRQACALKSGNRKVVRLLSPNAFSYGSPDGREINLKAIRDLLAAVRKAVTAESKIIFAHFPSEARPEHITPETLELLKEFADNDEIVIGAQSGSRRMLESCRRAHTVESVLAAVSLARKHGFKVIVDFIYGLPGETAEDSRESLAVMEDVVRMGARIHPHIFAPLPQTPFSGEEPGKISPVFRRAIERIRERQGIYENPPRLIERF
jgi:B12-binding domain/radical SAM domain protein